MTNHEVSDSGNRDNLILEKIDYIVSKRHIEKLSSIPLKPCPNYIQERKAKNSACLFPIHRIVYDRLENNFQKLTNIYVGASSANANVVMIINHPEVGKDVEIYMGVCDEENRDIASSKADVFYRNLIGNFPGCQTGHDSMLFLSEEEAAGVMAECLNYENHAVSCVSGVASLRNGTKQENTAYFQGIEKLIEGMEDRTYSVILLAHAINSSEAADIQAEYENLYNQLSPYAKSSMSVNRSNAESTSKTLSDSLSDTLSMTKSSTLSVGESTSSSENRGGFMSTSDSVNLNGGGGIKLPFADLHIDAGASHSSSRGKNWSNTLTAGLNKSSSEGESETSGKTTTVTSTDGRTFSITEGQSVQLNYENKTVQEILSTIDQKIKRIRAGSGLGMFAVSAYFISVNEQGTKSAASIYKATITGDNTSVENASINTWCDEEYEGIKLYLESLCHPVFQLDPRTDVTPASIVTAAELAIHMGLPKSSVTGIPVSNSVSFGRSVLTLQNGKESRLLRAKRTLDIGKVYHLGRTGGNHIKLDLNSLSMHTLLCGTTGVGKSNTSYLILKNLPKDVHFLVVEPAKGEYKNAFAQREDVSVYGSNPYYTPLLRINPFYFSESVHVLEHLERLVSIFNVCWPMEAAMPAVLKEALERAYRKAGWDLQRSVNCCSAYLFPSFEDVMHEVRNIMEESQYSEENKGNYIGALCTRLRELTTGLNRMIFTEDALSDEELFDCNTILDLSRIGSSETKALIMGIIVIRLQEYRQGGAKGSDTEFTHLTVLEEAHHLLKRTSSVQSVDSANLMGRSVEMISNAFAEMRTYGEGFLIVDQSPEQLDKSVIRNTNTKIVMRLPEYEDRKLVGKAIGLNEDQLVELAKLPTGVAAVYQNNWLDTVLVSIPYTKGIAALYTYKGGQDDNGDIFSDKVSEKLLDAIMAADIDSWLNELDGERILNVVSRRLPTGVKMALVEYFLQIDEDSTVQEKFDRLSLIAYEYFNSEEALTYAIMSDCKDMESFKRKVLMRLKPDILKYRNLDALFAMLIYEHHNRSHELDGIYNQIQNFTFQDEMNIDRLL